MFEVAELGRTLDKEAYEQLEMELRLGLLQAQQGLRSCPFPVVVVFAGVDGAGKSETTNLLARWMDSRYVPVQAYGTHSDEERERPEFWRYWRDLPRNGRIGIFLSSWYSRPVLDWVQGRSDDLAFRRDLERIEAFERMLVEDGALVLKFWMHLSKDKQRKRLEKLESSKLESWRVRPEQWRNWEQYERFMAAAEETIRRTSTGQAPWHIVEGANRRYREATVATRLRDAMQLRLHEHERRLRTFTPAPVERRRMLEDAEVSPEPQANSQSVLHTLDQTRKHDKKSYKKALKHEHARLAKLTRQAREQGRSSVLVFEGWDAAGKGGAIKRLTDVLDARDYRVHPIAAPTEEERMHHYLWRFWRRIERAGKTTIFDRSWYGRVLVERVEGFASEETWRRAYAEIRHFEEQLVDHGTVFAKFWLHITPEEQLQRFQARERTPHKQWKLTDEDWRNRERWADYESAVDAMVERTSTREAPWTLVPANNKYDARLMVVRTFADRLEQALD